MVLTIYVVYTDQKLGYAQIRSMKQYMFLCPFDNIQAGDMIKDKRYSTAMQVVGWDKNSCEVQNGIKLIAIYEHRTVQYAGIVYFKNAQDAKEAAKLLFDELNLLF